MIRFHSFYPWHTGGAYMHFMQSGDEQLMQDILEFNKYDLYSKEDTDFVLTDEIRTYYAGLLDEYFPEPLTW
jgi:inositol oxygenase